MKKTMISLSFLLLAGSFMTAAAAAPALAAWSGDPSVNTPVTTAGNQTSQVMVSDGSGGAIVSWVNLDEVALKIYVQRLTADGSISWDADGVPLSTSTTDQSSQQMISDGSGGVIVAWQEWRNDSALDIYVQRVSADGSVMWDAAGVAITSVIDNQYAPQLVSDGSGGAIIVWADRRQQYWEIYAQRIDAGGNLRWVANGVPVAVTDSIQPNPQVVSDRSGGAIVAWEDYRAGNYDIYAQRMDGSGKVLWTANGIAVCAADNAQTAPTVVSDGSGGAIVAWEDERAGNYDIYTQRIDANGARLWAAGGVAVAAAAADQRLPQVVGDGSGGAVFVWEDNHSGSWEIYARRADAGGAMLWPTRLVAATSSLDTYPSRYQGTSDGRGGAIIAWEDFRNEESDVYAQRIDAGGSIQWAAGGVAVSTALSDQVAPVLVASGGGAIIAWEDWRGESTVIYAQKVYGGGTLSAVVTSASLSVMVQGAGGGTVHSTPPDINCSSGTCSQAYPFDSNITLTPTAAVHSLFGGWSGDCTGPNGDCGLVMDQGRVVLATFVINPAEAVRVDPVMAYFASIGSAYQAAASGASIKACRLDFTENLLLDQAKTVTLSGGYSSDYASNTGETGLVGALTVKSGVAIVERIVVK